MSLKAFHVVFILISIVLTAWFGWWSVSSYRNTADVSNLVMGVFSFIGMVLLVLYFRWFLKKLKNESYL
jgi:hypothetical protein